MDVPIILPSNNKAYIYFAKRILYIRADKIYNNRLLYRGKVIYINKLLYNDFIKRVGNIDNLNYLTDDPLVTLIPTTLNIYYHPEGIYMYYEPPYLTDEPEMIREKIIKLRMDGYYSKRIYNVNDIDDGAKCIKLVNGYGIFKI
jgi:hypothetical protein